MIGIDSVGNVKGCESLYSDEFIEGNLRLQSLAEIWYGVENFAYNRAFHPDKLEGRSKVVIKEPFAEVDAVGPATSPQDLLIIMDIVATRQEGSRSSSEFIEPLDEERRDPASAHPLNQFAGQ